jgi:hypothetical protein
LKHDQAHALLDLLGHKGQQRGGVRAHSAVAVAARECEASGEQREEEGVKAAHDAGLQRADGQRRFSEQAAAAAETGEPSALLRIGSHYCMMMVKAESRKQCQYRCGVPLCFGKFGSACQRR